MSTLAETKLPCVSILLICLFLSARSSTYADAVTPAQAVERAPQSLKDLGSAVDQLKSSPDSISTAYVSAFSLIQAADEYVVRKEPTNAVFYYTVALTGLRALQTLRPDWQPAMVSYRIRKIDEKIKETALQMGHVQSPSPTTPEIKPLNPSRSSPDGWREFEFNGQKYYYAPLSTLTGAAGER